MQKAKKLGWSVIPTLARYLLGEKLTSFAAPDEIFGIGDGRGPIKTSSESFADQVSGGHVIATGTRVNFK